MPSACPVLRIGEMSSDAALETALSLAARAVGEAEALVISAGAGMGVDSGLPDFRGPEGFWNAYPAFRELGLRFEQLANPEWFFDDPALAWGFYGHRLNLYRRTVPHEGFAILQKWAAEKPHGAFVFTSNVDGQFQKAGFPENRIVECHGSIHYLQCLRSCGEPIRSADGIFVEIDETTCRARPPLPFCPSCRGLARPNILMFGDMGWDDTRTDAQHATLGNWLDGVRGPLVVLELGAGTNVPTVRMFSERAARAPRRTLVRINPREPQLGAGISLPLGALEAIRRIDTLR